MGWRYGFIAPGVLSLIVAVVIYKFLKDRPQTLGLPKPEIAFAEHVIRTNSVNEEKTWHSQLYVLKSKTVWVIALACAGMYISRYAVNSWAILYLQEAKSYTLIEAGTVMAVYPIAGLIGSVLSGVISDKYFKSDRKIPATLYGLANVFGMLILFYGGQSKVLDSIALTLFGFGIGGLIVFLAGLMAADIMPKNAVGAVKGFIGLFAYIGAASQEYISSILIRTNEINGVQIYDFSQAKLFWIGAGVASILLTAMVKVPKTSQSQKL